MASTSEQEPIEAAGAGRLVCAECSAESPPEATGWRGYLTDGGEAVMFCPKCAEREFD